MPVEALDDEAIVFFVEAAVGFTVVEVEEALDFEGAFCSVFEDFEELVAVIIAVVVPLVVAMTEFRF